MFRESGSAARNLDVAVTNGNCFDYDAKRGDCPLNARDPFLAITLVTLALAGCTDTAELREQSLTYQKAYCASKGKQFLWQDTKTEEGVITRSVTAEGRCVGPGDAGYEPPTTAKQRQTDAAGEHG
jgi:hypothetical protein